ncbi:MAG: (2Fe-2S)-binding protein [Alphaproteobacteria bacterium]|nr:(2Fe-2S)-binding protein [Alphaproteobacteria bacterium]
MYICLCHGFTDGDVRGAISNGCKSVAAVYRHLADRPQCGKCVPDVRCMLHEHREAQHGAAVMMPAMAAMEGAE